MTASPIRRMAHLGGGWLAGSLADEGCSQELAALIEHGLFDDMIRLQQYRLRDRQSKRLRGLQIDHQLKLRGLLDG